MPTYDEALKAVRTLIEFIGDDPKRPGLRETPKRVLHAWMQDWGVGYANPNPEELLRMFENGEGSTPYDQMVVMRGISYSSHCEHHIVPFFGSACIAYIPGEAGIVGLSKLARVVEHFARRLQTQERLVEQVAEFLHNHLAQDVAVSLEATHLCMVSRGVRQPHAITVTTALRGAFYNDPTTRSEFLAACKN
jgi:GTP cyclohydrolase I